MLTRHCELEVSHLFQPGYAGSLHSQDLGRVEDVGVYLVADLMRQVQEG